MMDDIRRRQIAEVLDYDKNMNLQVVDMYRKSVARMEPEDHVGISQNQELVDTSNTSISSFLVVLDKRRADVATIKSWKFNAQEKIYSNTVSALGNISEIVDTYNQLMSNYLSNPSTQTKRIMLSNSRRALTIRYKKSIRACYRTIHRMGIFWRAQCVYKEIPA